MFKDDVKLKLEEFVDPKNIEDVRFYIEKHDELLVGVFVRVFFEDIEVVFDFIRNADEDNFIVTDVEKDGRDDAEASGLLDEELTLDEMVEFSKDAHEVDICYITSEGNLARQVNLYNDFSEPVD